LVSGAVSDVTSQSLGLVSFRQRVNLISKSARFICREHGQNTDKMKKRLRVGARKSLRNLVAGGGFEPQFRIDST